MSNLSLSGVLRPGNLFPDANRHIRVRMNWGLRRMRLVFPPPSDNDFLHVYGNHDGNDEFPPTPDQRQNERGSRRVRDSASRAPGMFFFVIFFLAQLAIFFTIRLCVRNLQ